MYLVEVTLLVLYPKDNGGKVLLDHRKLVSLPYQQSTIGKDTHYCQWEPPQQIPSTLHYLPH